jgi:hypothetical protein
LYLIFSCFPYVYIFLHYLSSDTQGSALSSYIFTLVMDEITKNIQEDIPWYMLFADDVVLIEESRIRVDQKLEL